MVQLNIHSTIILHRLNEVFNHIVYSIGQSNHQFTIFFSHTLSLAQVGGCTLGTIIAFGTIHCFLTVWCLKRVNKVSFFSFSHVRLSLRGAEVNGSTKGLIGTHGKPSCCNTTTKNNLHLSVIFNWGVEELGIFRMILHESKAN
jgi:hypothetical protein